MPPSYLTNTIQRFKKIIKQNTNIESLFEDDMNESNLNITISMQQLSILIDRTSYFLGEKK